MNTFPNLANGWPFDEIWKFCAPNSKAYSAATPATHYRAQTHTHALCWVSTKIRFWALTWSDHIKNLFLCHHYTLHHCHTFCDYCLLDRHKVSVISWYILTVWQLWVIAHIKRRHRLHQGLSSDHPSRRSIVTNQQSTQPLCNILWMTNTIISW